MKLIRVYRVQEGCRGASTYVCEYENDRWTSWTPCYMPIEQIFHCALKMTFYETQSSGAAVRRDLIAKIKRGKYDHCLIAERPQNERNK